MSNNKIRRVTFRGVPQMGSQGTPIVYPNSVVVAGLRGVWDLYNTSGPPISTVFTPFANYTKTASITQTTAVGGNAANITANNTIDGVDFTGFGIYIWNNGTTATIQNSTVTSATADFRLWNGQDGNGISRGTPTLIFKNSNLNLSPGENADHAMIQNFTNSGPMTIDGCRIYNSPRTGAGFLKGTVAITNTLWGSFGTTNNPGDHTECIQCSDGTFTIDHALFDPTYGGTNVSGVSGDIQLQALGGVATSMTISNSIFAGSSIVDAPLSFKADFANVTVTLDNNVIQKGLQRGSGRTGYIITAGNAGHTLTIIDNGNNRDFDTGQILNLGGVINF